MADARVYRLDMERERRRLQARPRVVPCIGGTVCLTVGADEAERDEDMDLSQARELLDELADAIATAEWLVKVEREAERDG